MQISTKPNFESEEVKRNSSTYKRLKKTIGVYEWMQSKGYKPHDMSISIITMQGVHFKKFVKSECSGKCSRTINKHGTIYSVWVGYVEVTYLDPAKRTETWENYEFKS